METLLEKGKNCKEASYQLMQLTSDSKNKALEHIYKQLNKQTKLILEANQKDIENAIKKGKDNAFIDRLTLSKERMNDIIDGVKQVITLEDPTNQIVEEWDMNELHFIKKSVPIGVIGIIYEARPNVSVDAACLCLKSGNVCFLRGSSDTIHSNKALVKAMKDGLIEAALNENFIALLEDTSREVATSFMKMNNYLDLLIPRGSANLIRSTLENATVPIIETGTGNCHVYIDKDADIEKAIPIVINAKTQRISVCNACESVLIHKDIKDKVLPLLIQALKKFNVKIHGCEISKTYDDSILLATDDDYAKEYLGYEISIKVINTLEEAIDHINHYNTKHSDCIISENKQSAQQFLNNVDSAVVYVNASTRFSDGFEFGFGAEIGISTQKIHARGPMGLKALTSYKYQVIGNGTIRK